MHIIMNKLIISVVDQKEVPARGVKDSFSSVRSVTA